MTNVCKARSPICSVVGHVDHGKSSILDRIRNSKIVDKEAGGITQAIGASIVPFETICKNCIPVLGKLDNKIRIPGILFIDTPGHAAFTNLRKIGGNLSDIAVLVVDINEGFKPQTIESVKILKMYKTPFVIAANKIDKISGYSKKDNSVIKSISMQKEDVLQKVEDGIYSIVGQLYELGINSERFDRVSDYTKQIAIVPCSALTGEGIAEMLMLISGLAQKFLECDLSFSIDNLAKGTILEVMEVKGLGVTIDVILFDGTLKVGDTICLGGLNGPIVTKVKALLMPSPLSEIRDKKAVFKSVKNAVAATGVKISAPLLDEAMAGTPIFACKNAPEDIEDKKKQLLKEINTVFIETQKSGLIVKADSLGSLEALVTLLKEEKIPIRKASVGDITKNDFLEAEGMLLEKPELAVILGFNVGFKCNPEDFKKVKVINNEVIYRIIEEYKKWSEEIKKLEELKRLGELTSPCKIKYLPNHTFRQSNPAIVGVEIIAGTLKVGARLMKENGNMAGIIKGIQIESESLKSADANSNVAVSINDVCCGRQINEGEIYYSAMNEEEFKKLKNAKELLSPAQIEVLKEIAIIMRKSNEMWGV